LFFNDGGYATLSFIPTLGTMILGLIAGKVLRSGTATMAEGNVAVPRRRSDAAGGAALGWLWNLSRC